MKITKYILTAAVVLALAACNDEPTGVSTKVPVGSEPENPTPPGEDDPSAGDDIVSPTPDFALNNEKVTVDPSKRYQTMEGFAASDCWLPAQIGKYWTQNRLQIATWLFSKGMVGDEPQGIGLSMWRVNLGAGTAEQGEASGIAANNRAEAYLVNGQYDWNKCEGQRYFMAQALRNGCESFVFFSNSPLVQWTKNGKGYSDAGSNANLKEEHYGDFATYMATVAKHFVDEGYPVTHISPVNEPQNSWGGHDQEGSSWKNSEITNICRELDKALTDQNCNARILIPEAAAWEHLYKGNAKDRGDQIRAFFDDKLDTYVGDLSHMARVAAGHSYWSFDNWTTMRSERAKTWKAAEEYNVGLWQTEWSMLDREPSEIGMSYDDMTEWDIAYYMSKVINSDLVVANVSSWSYWTAMSVERYSQKNRFELIQTTPAGGNYSDDFTAEGSVRATHNLWVLGNYSLFVRPGYVRVDLAHRDEKEFFGSAWMSPDESKLVVVYGNSDKDKGVLLDHSIVGDKEVKSIFTYTTSAAKNLQQARFNVKDKVFLDPYSVTTVVYNF